MEAPVSTDQEQQVNVEDSTNVSREVVQATEAVDVTKTLYVSSS